VTVLADARTAPQLKRSAEKSMDQTLESKIARIFLMSDETWARHANPWSVWTRLTTLPVLIAAIWSRIWIGYWAWGMVCLAILWIWINPRLFKKPDSTNNWASKGVLGERVWLNRKRTPVPQHHRILPNLLNVLSGVGLLFVGWGQWYLEIWPTLLGTLLIYIGKLWFLDRMVWLYEEVGKSEEEYSTWLYDNRAEQVAGGDHTR
jgi:hypothetical protein